MFIWCGRHALYLIGVHLCNVVHVLNLQLGQRNSQISGITLDGRILVLRIIKPACSDGEGCLALRQVRRIVDLGNSQLSATFPQRDPGG